MDLESSINSFTEVLEHLTKNYVEKQGELVSFWRESFNQYVGKMRLPKNIHDKPRRYFHLHAMLYCLKQTDSTVVWNLSVGNIKTSIPVLDYFVQESIRTGTKTHWINIDIVSDIKKHNVKFLKSYYTSQVNRQASTSSKLVIQQTAIYNITGSLEDFLTFFPKYFEEVDAEQHLFLCLDGISNVSIEPANWLSWWVSTRRMLDTHFAGWYLTWLQSMSLLKKFDFYYHVVYSKHQIPMQWIETTKIVLVENSMGELGLTLVDSTFSKFTIFSVQELGSIELLTSSNFIFRFYSDQDKTLLVYQALYFTEESVNKLSKTGALEYIGHKAIDALLFEVTDSLYNNANQNFVKSLPHVHFRKKLID